MPAVSSSLFLRTIASAVQSLPETVQLPRPPGIWTVPGAFVFCGASGDVAAVAYPCLICRRTHRHHRRAPNGSSNGSWDRSSSGVCFTRSAPGHSTTTHAVRSSCWHAWRRFSDSGWRCSPPVEGVWNTSRDDKPGIQALGVSRGIGCHTRRRVDRCADTIAYAPGFYASCGNASPVRFILPHTSPWRKPGDRMPHMASRRSLCRPHRSRSGLLWVLRRRIPRVFHPAPYKPSA